MRALRIGLISLSAMGVVTLVGLWLSSMREVGRTITLSAPAAVIHEEPSPPHPPRPSVVTRDDGPTPSPVATPDPRVAEPLPPVGSPLLEPPPIDELEQQAAQDAQAQVLELMERARSPDAGR